MVFCPPKRYEEDRKMKHVIQTGFFYLNSLNGFENIPESLNIPAQEEITWLFL